MKRSNPKTKAHSRLNPHNCSKKMAIHEAGHAVAIHLGNQAKQLPPVFFQLVFKEPGDAGLPVQRDDRAASQRVAHIEGGRLIDSFPQFEVAFCNFPAFKMRTYRRAFEADIINFLVGPLAEAKFVALSDNELINPRLVNLDSLLFYGGTTDLEMVHEYLDCQSSDQGQKEQKIRELFLAAYAFINDRTNWSAIIALADFIIDSGKKVISCDEAISFLDAHLLKHNLKMKSLFPGQKPVPGYFSSSSLLPNNCKKGIISLH